ncbi:MAG: hypothetical protein ACLQIB_05545 [Isosphaeraceae bacterium]
MRNRPESFAAGFSAPVQSKAASELEILVKPFDPQDEKVAAGNRLAIVVE